MWCIFIQNDFMNIECIIQQNLIEKYNFWNFIHDTSRTFLSI